MDAGKRTINDIFNGNRVLEIPFFQRSYVWKEDQWSRLLGDLEHVSEINRQYFLGSIILKQKPTLSDDFVGDRRTIIDGQQRLTTLSIFLQAWGIRTGNDKQLKLCRVQMDENQIAIEHNYNDIHAYNTVLNHTENTPLPGDGQIIGAFNYFLTNIDPEKLSLPVILRNIIFIGIDLIADEDEQQIFDTINTLGVKLGASEKLKNYLFNKQEVAEYEKLWRLPFENDSKTKKYWDQEVNAGRIKRSLIDLFLYAFLQIKLQDKNYNLTAKEKTDLGKVEQLFESFQQFVEKTGTSKAELRQEILDYAKVFKANFDPNTMDQEIPAEDGFLRINTLIFGLENSTLIPYCLYILKHQSDVSAQNELFGYLEAYIMRRMICKEVNKNYNNLFSEQLIGNQALDRDSLHTILSGKDDKTNVMSPDFKVVEAFAKNELTNKQAAGILYFLETKIRDRKKHTSQLYGLSRYSLEHLMPKKWRNHWDPVESREQRDKLLLTLGNLTILTSSLNTSLKDASWNLKVNGSGYKGGLKHYAQGLDTFSYCLDFEEWNEDRIHDRAKKLSDLALQAWSINIEIES